MLTTAEPGRSLTAQGESDLESDSREWVAEALGPAARVTWTRRIRGGAEADVWRLAVRERSGRTRRLILKQAHNRGRGMDAEAAALDHVRLLEVPTPEVIALGGVGDGPGRPSLLMSWVPGRTRLSEPVSGRLVADLVWIAARVHDFSQPSGWKAWKPPTWHLNEVPLAPEWSGRRREWELLAELAGRPLPQEPTLFVHGDLHSGNVLWNGNTLSGVVDWGDSGLAPIGADLAHCRWFLAMIDGVEAAERFLKEYRRATGRALENQAAYDAVPACGFAAEPFEAWDWNGFGRPDLTPEILRRRQEEFVDIVLRGAGLI